ncbi:MAG: HD domain-containing protein [Dehalococcoidia bacterium]|nr:HD domain-containing protein [Dehalococcoidia bacterium]
MIEARHEIRDPIHGLIRLTDQEISIINTPPFQRLRRIKQLALANLVYPGALHTRFEHSLGTLHIADRIMSTVAMKEQLYDNDIEIVRLAALLHDIGHGPFSHVSEYLLDDYYQPPAGTPGTREKIHEKLTMDIISHESSIAEKLSDQQRESVRQMIQGSNRRDMRRDIVSSDLDADKIDYLLRDAYYAGVKYGVIDSDKIIDSFRSFSSGSETFLSVDESGIFAVEQLILAKHHMTQQVYSHRIRVITDYMIVRGLRLAIEDGLAEIKDLYFYDGSEDFCRNYIGYSDEDIFDVVLKSEFERPRRIFDSLRSRRLYKQILGLRLTPTYVPDAIVRSRLVELSQEEKKNLECELSTRLGCESWEVIVEVKNVKNPAYQAPGVLEPEAILIVDREGGRKSMKEYEELVSGELPSFNTLHVIAPCQLASANRPELAENIREAIFQYAGGSV